ncbi:hypothetical protein [Patulibacter defluvii]|uniref:hypothetical protein n=1 Tax=Patulibacter defluvii TaxID=3095358 RepID=UPI002A7617D4|nr:hypothetical protein [Patulibacter sp. DM4]
MPGGRHALRGAAVGAALAVATGGGTAAAAYLPGALPASATATELSDRGATAPLVSGDGRYVVFRTSSQVLLGRPSRADEHYVGGLVRKDLETGAVELVAPPVRALRATGEQVGTGVDVIPSGVSRDGRYVLFGTTVQLASSSVDRSTITPDVYLRDMAAPASDVGAYELVSAQDGRATGASYGDATLGAVPGRAGASLSDDGRRAVFVTRTTTNLPARSGTTTPRWQVLVRDLDAQRTRLITRRSDDLSDDGSPVAETSGAPQPLAALSGDGRTVVWLGGSVVQQTPRLAGEPVPPSELLWRDLDGDPAAPAGRVAGAADPADPACPPGSAYVADQTATGPCTGPFATSEALDRDGNEASPQFWLADDGRRLLFTSAARERPFDPVAYRSTTVYLAELRTAAPRREAVRRAWSTPADRQATPLALAGDGRQAFLWSSDFRFDGLQQVGSVRSLPGADLYVADLDARTAERVTTAVDGGDYVVSGTGGATAVADASDDGGAIVFLTADANLFVGDANGAVDVVVARREPPRGSRLDGRELPPPPPPAVVDDQPLAPLPSRYPVVERLTVSPRTGTARVTVRLPAAGRLRSTATGRGTWPARRGRRARTLTVAVARRVRSVDRARRITVVLPPSRAARALLRSRPHRLRVRLRLRYEPRAAAPVTVARSYVARRPAGSGR